MIVATPIPQISYAFTRIERAYIFRKNSHYIPHSIEWVKPFDQHRDNTWELNVKIFDHVVNVNAIGEKVFVNGDEIDGVFLKSEIARRLGLES
jgi:hypothetical protein